MIEIKGRKVENGDRNLEIGTSKLELGPHGPGNRGPEARGLVSPAGQGGSAWTLVCEGWFYLRARAGVGAGPQYM